MGKKIKYTLENFKNLKKDLTGEEFVEEKITKIEGKDEIVNNIDHIQKIRNNDRKAKAPYNFVPLNRKVVKSDFDIELSPFDKYHAIRKTGYIDLNITTFTPMYIRDNKNDGARDDEKNPDFFAPGNGMLRLPGSSVRGLIRSLVEIVSYGKFENFDDKRLYMRGMADKCKNLRDDYQETMIDTGNNYFPKIKSGWIKKTGFKKYIIYPSILDNFGNQFYRINFDKTTGNIINSGTPLIKLTVNEFKEIYFSTTPAQDHTHQRTQNGKKIPYKLKYALVNGISNTETVDQKTKGYVINTGSMNNKHMHWIINESNFNKGTELDYNIIKDYLEDENRESLNIVNELISKKNGLPCFYVEDDNKKIVGFGYTAMFRLPYKKSIGEHIPDTLKDIKSKDFAEAIFGNETEYSGRVFVEDAFNNNSNNSEILLGENFPKNLSGPKPTTFQHYLTQSSEELRDLKHYNPDSSGGISTIRGNKLYWHKENENWKADEKDVKKYPKQFTSRINPVRKDTVFTGRIRFENLSDVELGALLFALYLPEGCLHKIGMGKPLGLGSIKITPTLHLSDREKRYSELFAEWSENNKEIDDNNLTINTFKDKFANYILKQLYGENNEYTRENLWDEERMKELARLLDWRNKPGNDETRYMTIQPVNEFKNRPVLPRPTNVK